eukprot:scaffold1172_cov247-Pinguiococcus_pyrenoidosus.AAC.2
MEGFAEERRFQMMRFPRRSLPQVLPPRCSHLDAPTSRLRIASLPLTRERATGDGFAVVFADPPWGGTTYSKRDVVPDLELGDATMTSLCAQCAKAR